MKNGILFGVQKIESSVLTKYAERIKSTENRIVVLAVGAVDEMESPRMMALLHNGG